MTTRTPAAKTPASTAATAGKKTPAKKTPAKRTPGKRSLSRPAAADKPQATRPATIVNLYKLPTARRRDFVGPLGAHEQAAVRAALAAASARLPISVRAWNGSTAQLADGTLLIHNPGPDRKFTAHIACRHGAIHGWPITTHTDLREARAVTHACERPHARPSDDGDVRPDWDGAITYGVRPVPAPKPSVVLVLREGVHRAQASAADTQPIDTLPEQAKEHPEP